MKETKIAEMEYTAYKTLVEQIKEMVGSEGLLGEQSHVRTFDTFHSVTGHFMGETFYLEGIITNDKKKARDVCYRTASDINAEGEPVGLKSLVEQSKQEIAA